MYECQNCGKSFDAPEIIDEEKRCPHCYSGDVIGGEEGEE